jgi:hypothetical protein
MRWRLPALCAAVFGLLLLVLVAPGAASECPMTASELSSSPGMQAALKREGCAGEASTLVILLQSCWHAAAVANAAATGLACIMPGFARSRPFRIPFILDSPRFACTAYAWKPVAVLPCTAHAPTSWSRQLCLPV